jgi:gamma-glutamylcyclotransferase
MPKLLYLAYGSNLHPLRLAARVPSARTVGIVEMPGNLLAFHKRSIDGSGKCLFYTGQGQHEKMFGVLYEFDPREKIALDKAEGSGSGYCEQLMKLPLNGETFTPFVYVAQSTHIDPALVPYDWYKGLVIAGARYHSLPSAYISSLEAIPSMPDTNTQRRHENESRLRHMGQG